MADELAQISETCRCGASTKLTGEHATSSNLNEWRASHLCMSTEEVRFRDTPSPNGAGTAMLGFRPQFDHDDRPPLR